MLALVRAGVGGDLLRTGPNPIRHRRIDDGRSERCGKPTTRHDRHAVEADEVGGAHEHRDIEGPTLQRAVRVCGNRTPSRPTRHGAR